MFVFPLVTHAGFGFYFPPPYLPTYYLPSLLLDENGVLYSCGAFLGGALGHGNLDKQEYPMSIQYFGEEDT